RCRSVYAVEKNFVRSPPGRLVHLQNRFHSRESVQVIRSRRDRMRAIEVLARAFSRRFEPSLCPAGGARGLQPRPIIAAAGRPRRRSGSQRRRGRCTVRAAAAAAPPRSPSAMPPPETRLDQHFPLTAESNRRNLHLPRAIISRTAALHPPVPAVRPYELAW